jgi:hypothetical protein
MTNKTWAILVISCGAMLAGFGSAEAEKTGALVCRQVEAASSMTPPPLQMQSLHPECCRTISSTPESTCDSVSYSPGRCEQYFGGGRCAWTCYCCKPKSAQYSSSYCGQFDPYGADRCNQVWQGTACQWTC